jgi:hypothetical protein
MWNSWAIVLQQNWTFNRWIIPPDYIRRIFQRERPNQLCSLTGWHYNSEENPNIKDTDYRIFARITQRIASTYKSEEGASSSSAFRNVYFSFQAEYNKNQQLNQDPDHKDDFWRYGWNGQFSKCTCEIFCTKSS